MKYIYFATFLIINAVFAFVIIENSTTGLVHQAKAAPGGNPDPKGNTTPLTCQPVGNVGEWCKRDASCNDPNSMLCNTATKKCESAGGPGQQCLPGGGCTPGSGLTCQGGICNTPPPVIAAPGAAPGAVAGSACPDPRYPHPGKGGCYQFACDSTNKSGHWHAYSPDGPANNVWVPDPITGWGDSPSHKCW